MQYFITSYNQQTGAITGSGTASDDSPSPDGAIPCSQEQAENPQSFAVADGEVVAISGVAALAKAQVAQKAAIDAAYQADVSADIAFKTAAGVSQSFQADADSQMVLMQATQGYQIAGTVPANFFWKAADNSLVAFTLADLEGLYVTVLARGWEAFQKRATFKAEIEAATTVEAVEAIAWA